MAQTAYPVRALNGRLHYGWIVVGVTFLALLVSAGIRAAPGVLIYPLETDLGWSRAAIAFAVSIGLLLYGLAGPFAGRAMDRLGPRRVVLVGLALIAASTAASAAMTALWQLNLLWGVLSGLGTGAAASVLGAAVATRWFVARRGLVLGLFGAAASAGQLVFVPLLMWLVVAIGWRPSTLALAAVVLAVLVPVLLLMRDEPADVGLHPYGGPPPAAAAGVPSPAARAGATSNGVMARAVRVPEFWLLAGSFFVCGATSNGLIGTHFVPHSIDHGIPEVVAAGALALMGAMNFAGTLASGWLTDRFDPRRLLACYYSFRGLSLFLLPFVTDFSGLAVFAVVFGLDYIATVPPTAALAADLFGRRHVGTVFGWVFFAHQVGAALTAYLGGLARVTLGDYQAAFLVAGLLALMGGVMALRVDRHAAPVPAVATT
jgi:sugar phosphate permease